MQQWRSLGILAVLISNIGAVAGVASQYSHRIWRIEDGLPQNRIRALAQTPDGYLWVGTSEGLARFDGVRFTLFDRSNTPAFQDNGILALRLARNGVLWIGTEGGGLMSYQSGIFHSFGAPEGLTNGFVRCIYEDRDGILWVGTDRGFFRLDGNTFTRLDGTAEIPLATAGSIAQDEQGRIWVNTPVGLLTVKQGRLVRAREACPGPAFRNIVESRPGVVWALNTTGASQLRDGCPISGGSLPDVPIRALTEDAAGDMWIGTAGLGLDRLAGGGIGEQRTRFNASSILPDNTVNAIFEDREQNLWVGTEDGLLRLSRSYILTLGSEEGLEDDNVLTTYAGGRYLWMATLTGQVYRAEGSKVTRFQLPPPANGLHVRTILEDRAGTLWLGTLGDGLIRIADGKTTVYSKSNGLRSNSVRQLLQDSSGGIWIALDSGLSRWDGSAFHNYYLEDGLTYPSTRCMILDASGDVLVGTDKGLNRLHDGKIVADPQFAAVAAEKIWAMYEDTHGALWLGTRGDGLLRLSAGKLARFTSANGLPSDTIYQILKDSAGKFWMSTSSGIFSADPKEFSRVADNGAPLIHVISYGTAEGMRTSQMNGGIQPAGARMPSGDLWFPSVKGAVRIDPTMVPSRKIPPILIERMLVDDTPVPISGEVILPPGSRKVEIDFTVCDLEAPQRARFRYKLESFDETWKPALRTRSAAYTNLPPGHYRFRVSADDSSSTSGASEATLAFTLRPKIYQSSWFYGAIALTCGALIWAGMLFYARQTRARYALLLNERMAERNRVAREMHDTVIQGCVGVATLLEAADRFRGVDTAAAEGLLEDARTQISNTLEEARQAIWDLRHAPVENASITMLFDLARKLGAERNIEIETEILGKGELDPETDRTVMLVGREALRNAVSHACAKRIRISVSLQPSEVILEISDDGTGFSEAGVTAARNKHFGVIGMRERVEKAGGSLRIESGQGTGTRIIARVPLSGDAVHRLDGTLPVGRPIV